MLITFDRQADAAYVYLVDTIEPGEVAATDFANIPLDNAPINVDFDFDGRVLGIEILGARRVLRAASRLVPAEGQRKRLIAAPRLGAREWGCGDRRVAKSPPSAPLVAQVAQSL
jgi:uncharacterized protein YuzE